MKSARPVMMVVASLAALCLASGGKVDSGNAPSGVRARSTAPAADRCPPLPAANSPRPAPPAKKAREHADQAPRKSNQASKRSRGSAATLRDKVYLCHLFVSDKESSWKAREKEAANARMKTATDFLLAQAAQHKVRLSFIQKTLKDAACDAVIPTDMLADHQWIEKVVQQAGYGSANELVEAIRAEHPTAHVLLAFHVNKKATSFNLSYSEGVHPAFLAERIVMYANYRDGRPTCAASYAHEILHGFGAGELFFPFDSTPERKTLAGKLFPNDIMTRVDYDINKLTIGDYTAYRIGWLNKLDPQYLVFED